MRADTYNTTIAHTSYGILAVECIYEAGSKDNDEIVCVCNLPIVYKVTEMLLKDPAKHIMLELRSCVACLTENWPADTVTHVKQSVIVMMEAA